MALTVAKLTTGAEFTGRYRRIPANLTGDTSYPAGGYSLDGPAIGARPGSIIGVEKIGGNAMAAALRLNWDTTNKKLMLAQGGGQQEYVPGGGDIKGATNPAGTEGNADQNAAPVNSQLLLAETSFTTLAGTMTPTAQPDLPRNIMITIRNNSGGSLDLFQGTTTFLITGTDVNGAALTESVTLVSTSGNKAVANTKYRYVQGVKAFKTVTSDAITNAPAGGLLGSLGVGTRIGLPSPLQTPAVADVKQITVNAAPVTPSATVANAGGVDTTNNTVNAGTLADGADVAITFQASSNVATGMDLSGYTILVEIITK